MKPNAAPMIDADLLVVKYGTEADLPEEVRTASLNPANRFGKYILLRELGRGGVARVFLAWDGVLRQYVAVKRLRGDLGSLSAEVLEERRRMLVKEARSAIRLRHPGLVWVYDVGRIDDETYISMEYVEGETLDARLNATVREGHPAAYFADPPRLLALLAEIARAIDYAHTRPEPLIHCDLKPTNIMIDRRGHARILDFGLARNLHSDAAEDQDLISGTPGYMSPEQAVGEGSKIDARTDVYAFGAMLYECLTGRTPFVGRPADILRLTRTSSPHAPSSALLERTGQLSPNDYRIPAALEMLCLSCLERDPARRPSSLTDIAATLEAFVEVPPATPQEAREALMDPTVVIPLSSLSPRPSRRTHILLAAGILIALLGLGFTLLTVLS